MITRQQLLGLGVSEDAVWRALARGRLHRMHRGVYALVPRRALPPLALEHAAILACGPPAFVSHHSAAAVWGIRAAAHGPVEVIVVGDRARTRRGIHVHRAKAMARLDTRIHMGIPITSAARTLLDIAPDLTNRQLERALDEVLVTKLATSQAILATLEHNPGRPAGSVISGLLDPTRKTARTVSGGEERLLTLLRKAGLPQPEVNVAFGRYTADFVWRRERILVEVDGGDFHSRPRATERDHRRDVDFQLAGYLVVRITGRQLRFHPEKALVLVAVAFAQRRLAA